MLIYLRREFLGERGEGDGEEQTRVGQLAQDESDEPPVVAAADAVVEPNAVMVHPSHAEAAHGAMLVQHEQGSTADGGRRTAHSTVQVQTAKRVWQPE